MKLIDYNYTDEERTLYVEFSLRKDGDDFYRTIELEYSDIEYYSPIVINESDLSDIDDRLVLDVLEQYFKEHDYPEKITL